MKAEGHNSLKAMCSKNKTQKQGLKTAERKRLSKRLDAVSKSEKSPYGRRYARREQAHTTDHAAAVKNRHIRNISDSDPQIFDEK